MSVLPQFMAWSALCAELNFKFRNSRSFLYLFLDLLFGLFSASLLMRRWTDVSGHFWSALYLSIERLEQLITWLTNNPAGLKLNTALNTFLSNFFFYHIHLWKTYVAALEQFPTDWLLLASGAIGLTVLVAFVADFLRVLTIHIFFFHVYTHRLAKVSWNAVLGVARAFRGKKWNPLRRRVDSVRLDTRQLFIATCCLIILLFLLPTIGVYFVVFGTLWLSVECISQILRFAVLLLRNLFAEMDRRMLGTNENGEKKTGT